MTEPGQKLAETMAAVLRTFPHGYMCVGRVFEGWGCDCWRGHVEEAVEEYCKATGCTLKTTYTPPPPKNAT